MPRQLLATFSLSALLSLGLLQGLAHAAFPDVEGTNPHAAAITSLVEQGILVGYEDGTFKPDQDVTRAEALKIILLSMEIDLETEALSGVLFSDVQTEDWFYDIVSTAVTLGIVNGYPDGSFLPHQTVNRAEAVKMLTLAAQVENPVPLSAPFEDVAPGLWFSPYADYAKNWNIEPPQKDGLWHPADDISRANISEMVVRMQSVQASDQAFLESSHWLRKAFPTVNLSMKVPFSWNMKGDGVGALWLLDQANGQFSLLSPKDNGASLLMTRYSNSAGQSAASLFREIENDLQVSYLESSINGMPALTIYTLSDPIYREWYLFLENGNLVHLQALRGKGAYSPFLEAYLNLVVQSAQYSLASGVDPKAAALSAIQVDGVGQDTLDLFQDLILIETDAIGVGTGPVDYFYSPEHEITLKYERSFDVILDVEDGESTAF